MTFFEQQKKQFQEYCEELQDRFDLIIHEGVEIVFDKDFIQFDNLIVVRYSTKNVNPEIIVKDIIRNPIQFKLLKAVVDNFKEIVSCIKTYILLFNHVSVIKNKEITGDENYRLIFEGINEIIKENPSVLTGKTFFLKKSEKDYGDKRIYLSIDKFGQFKKTTTNLSYMMVDTETGDTDHFSDYVIENENLAGDIAFQVSNHVLTHLED